MAVGLPYFSAVPAQAVPAQFTIAFIGQGGTAYYRYIGHQPLYYLDYIDLSTEKTLYAVPGNVYAMLAVNSRAGLTAPPPDSWRWNPQSAQLGFMTPLRPRPRHIVIPPYIPVLPEESYRQYTGQHPVYYPDYTDQLTGQMLHVIPGKLYAPSPDIPPDAWRWGAEIPPAVQVPKAPVIIYENLAASKALSARLQAENTRKPYRQVPHLGKIKLPVIKKTPPSEASVAMADARALNARLQAAGRN